jgi:hypothetical protein
MRNALFMIEPRALPPFPAIAFVFKHFSSA